MLFPLRDRQRTRTTPIVTRTLLVANVLVHAWQMTRDRAAQEVLLERFGVIPNVLLHGGHAGSLITPLTSMFLHGGLAHLIGNLWFLFVFGDNVEAALGRARFATFYAACGLCAAGAQVAMSPASTVPMVGASGAIAGVLGAYMVFFPRARILALVPPFILLEVPAFVFLFVWIALELANAALSLGGPGDEGGVAFFAHVGGFIAGLALAPLLRRRAAHGRPLPRNVRITTRDDDARDPR
jgi:membrane associated rhomboid family serine protease